MTLKFQKFLGIKDDCDALSTNPPHFREADNVDIDDAGKKVSRRQGYGDELLSGNYHSIWNNRAKTLVLGVTGTNLAILNLGTTPATTSIIRSDLRDGLPMDYTEVNNKVWYSNDQVFGFIENRADGVLPAITKTGGSRMLPGTIIEYHEDIMYTVQGGRVCHSVPLDFGRTATRKNFLWFPGPVTMFRSVKDGIYCSFGNQTVFLSGSKPADFTLIPVADYAAIPGTAKKFDASLVSTNTPLQGDAVYWYSEKGPCIGFQGGQMLNLALTKYKAPTGVTGSAVIRRTAKGEGFMQALSIIQK